MKETALGHVIKTDHRDFSWDLDPRVMQRKKSPHRNQIVRGENCRKLSSRGLDQFLGRIVTAVGCPESVSGRTGLKSGSMQLGKPSFSSKLRTSIRLVAKEPGNSSVAKGNQVTCRQPGTANMVDAKRRE